MTKSSSNSIATTLQKTQTHITPRPEKNGEYDHAKPQEDMRVSHMLQRPIGNRALSNSRVELLSNHHDLAITPEMFQSGLDALIEPARNSPYTSGQVHEKASGQATALAVENSAHAFRWYAPARARSDPEVTTTFAKPKQQSQDVPLKTCLKKKAKSVITKPSERPELADRSSSEDKTLRRIKTVDFEKATRPYPVPPSPMIVSNMIVYGKSSIEASTLTQVSRKRPLCPNMMGTTKSTLADPATTRTDVHVIAIAPSQNMVDAGDRADIDPATPTMQIIESNNGSYEVMWDDVPAENKIQRKGRRSSADHSLRSVSSTATRDLQRVNSKLTDWSGSWNAPSDTFKPTIIVFPDEDNRLPYYECAVGDDDCVVTAPPNSQKTSAPPSRLPSRPTSAPLSRSASQEEIHVEHTLQEVPPEIKLPWVAPLADTLNIPDSDIQSTRRLNTTHRLRPMPTIRKLSNIEESDLKFRGHRDSVTLAHSRLMHSGAISSDLFAHRDSVYMAKKRMHARNHAISTARDVSIRTAEGDVRLKSTTSLDDSVLDMPTVKEKPVQALRSQKSASILGTANRAEAQRHIRIVE